ncbi:hypothetical protein BH10PSE19_BH10PSE19_08190 [soil metagenome]
MQMLRKNGNQQGLLKGMEAISVLSCDISTQIERAQQWLTTILQNIAPQDTRRASLLHIQNFVLTIRPRPVRSLTKSHSDGEAKRLIPDPLQIPKRHSALCARLFSEENLLFSTWENALTHFQDACNKGGYKDFEQVILNQCLIDLRTAMNHPQIRAVMDNPHATEEQILNKVIPLLQDNFIKAAEKGLASAPWGCEVRGILKGLLGLLLAAPFLFIPMAFERYHQTFFHEPSYKQALGKLEYDMVVPLASLVIPTI